MSTMIRSYKISSFSMIIKVTTIRYANIEIPDEAWPVLREAAERLCEARGFTFTDLEVNGQVVTFQIHLVPSVGDLGTFIGHIKSVWSRKLMGEFGFPKGIWIPRYLITTVSPSDAEGLERDWIEKINRAYLDKKGEA